MQMAMRSIQQLGFLISIFRKALLLIIITIFFIPTFCNAQVALPKRGLFTLKLFTKEIAANLPPYQSGLIKINEDLLSFILPNGYMVSSDSNEKQVLFISKKTGARFIFRFFTKDELEKVSLDKRVLAVKTMAEKNGESLSNGNFSFLGKSQPSFKYFHNDKKNLVRTKILHCIFPIGESGCELILNSSEIDFDETRRHLDLLIMTASLGDAENPPVIPELGTNI